MGSVAGSGSDLTPSSEAAYNPYSSLTAEATTQHSPRTTKQKKGLLHFKTALPNSSSTLWLAFCTLKSINRPYFLIPSSSPARSPSPLWPLSVPNHYLTEFPSCLSAGNPPPPPAPSPFPPGPSTPGHLLPQLSTCLSCKGEQ